MIHRVIPEQKRPGSPGLGRWLLLYVVAYSIGAGLDLWTTAAATGQGIAEGNTYTLSNGTYVALRAAAINFVGGLIMLTLWGAGIDRAASVSPRWLDRPFASWGKFYFNPLARAVADRAPLHLLAWALAFVIFRVLAAVNNLMLISGLPGPIGWTIFAIAPTTGQTAAFILVVAFWYVALAILVSPIAVAILRRRRKEMGVTAAD
jgi:hypothetical protein